MYIYIYIYIYTHTHTHKRYRLPSALRLTCFFGLAFTSAPIASITPENSSPGTTLVEGWGFRVQGLGIRVGGLEFGTEGSGLGVYGSGFTF